MKKYKTGRTGRGNIIRKILTQKELTKLGELIYSKDDLMIVKLWRPEPFVRYMAIKIRKVDLALCYYNSQGDVPEHRAKETILRDHLSYNESDFARSYKEVMEDPRPSRKIKKEALSKLKTFSWPESTPKRLKGLKNKMELKLIRIYKEKKAALIKRGLPDW